MRRDWTQMIREFLEAEGGGGGGAPASSPPAGTPATPGAGAANPATPPAAIAPMATPATPALTTPPTLPTAAAPAAQPATPATTPTAGQPGTDKSGATGGTPAGTNLERDAQATNKPADPAAALAESQAIGEVYKAAAKSGQVTDPDYLEYLARNARAKDPQTFNPSAFVDGLRADPTKAGLFGPTAAAAPAPGATTTNPPPSGGPGAAIAAAQTAYAQAKAKGDVATMLALRGQLGPNEQQTVASIRG